METNDRDREADRHDAVDERDMDPEELEAVRLMDELFTEMGLWARLKIK